ncbi:MAG: TIM barrel protein [Clostridia bacterium]|nr:TIM barrel protein [Clostridia bacterium]
MSRYRLCLGTSSQYRAPVEEQITLIRNAGFDEVFFDWKKDAPVEDWCRIAKGNGIPVQSIHGPFGGCRAMWEAEEDAANAAYNDLLSCLQVCEKTGTPIMISHAFIGFEVEPIVKDWGLGRYGKLIREAQKRGVTIAFENTEGEEYLEAILGAFGGEKNVGFCWDTGHEMCYNHSEDMLAKYGRFLVCTHINDNLGIQNKDGPITWHDDLHLLPFDGIADWEYNAKRLAATGFPGPLTFELNTKSKPDRHENDRYDAMPLPDYLAEAYKRAVRVENLVSKQLK